MQALMLPPCMIICCGRAYESCLWFVWCSCVSFLSFVCFLSLPLGASMRSSINSNIFAVYHRCRLQIEQGIHDFRDLNQSRNRRELFQHFVVVVRVHRLLHHTHSAPLYPTPTPHAFHPHTPP